MHVFGPLGTNEQTDYKTKAEILSKGDLLIFGEILSKGNFCLQKFDINESYFINDNSVLFQMYPVY